MEKSFSERLLEFISYVRFFQSDKTRNEEFCWKTCEGKLNEGSEPEIPKNIEWAYTPSYSINITWDGNGTLYLFEIANSENRDHFVSLSYFIITFHFLM